MIPAATRRYRVYGSFASGKPRKVWSRTIGFEHRRAGLRRLYRPDREDCSAATFVAGSVAHTIQPGRRPWRLASPSLFVLHHGAARMFFVRGAALLDDAVVRDFEATSNGPPSIGHNQRARIGGTTGNKGTSLSESPNPSGTEKQTITATDARHDTNRQHEEGAESP